MYVLGVSGALVNLGNMFHIQVQGVKIQIEKSVYRKSVTL
jgi:hypothetical protein